MEFITDILTVAVNPSESDRRRPGAAGSSIILADGQPWLLASPVFHPRVEGLTRPLVDSPLDNLFERAIRGDDLDVGDLFEIARHLLLANYDLTQNEIENLLEFASGDESRRFFEGVLAALLGVSESRKSYTKWVRASLIAGGIADQEIPAEDLLDVLAILVATNRTVPLSKFADACREMDERSRLEMLI